MNMLQNILVVKLADIGDAVLALPAVQALREALPGASIDMLSTAAGAQVFRRSPAVDDVHVLANRGTDLSRPWNFLRLIRDSSYCLARMRKTRYQATVHLHHLTTANGARKHRLLLKAIGAPIVAGLDNGRGTFLTHRAEDQGFGAMPEWEYGLEVVRALGISARASRPALKIPESVSESAAKLLSSVDGRLPLIIIHTEVGEFSPARAWPMEHFVSLAEILQEEPGAQVVFVGTDSNSGIQHFSHRHDRVLDLTGQTSFDELCAIVQKADLVIGGDSAVTHLAAACSRPVLALFGPTNISAWKPYGSLVIETGRLPLPGSKAVALTRALPCSPCVYTGFGIGRPQGCLLRPCLNDLTPETVSAAARQLLQATC